MPVYPQSLPKGTYQNYGYIKEKTNHTNRIQIYKENMRKIIKIQAIFRGYLIRKEMPSLVSNKKTKKIITKNSNGPPSVEFSQKTIEYKDGSIYVGMVKNGKRHGHGQQTWPDGAQYIGSWENDMTNGKGRFKYPDGDIYEGNWINDKANGFGEYLRVNGSKYVGEWQDDQQHGKGTETWPDGTKFVGNYMNGIKEGYGCYYWEDGTKYEGNWVNNKIEGHVFCWKICCKNIGEIYVERWKSL